MFQDEAVDNVDCPSYWKTNRETGEGGSQTEECQLSEEGVQSAVNTDAGTQTDPDKKLGNVQPEFDVGRLASFLERVTPGVMKELDKAKRSRAFDDVAALDEAEDAVAKDLYKLHPAGLKEWRVSGAAWSCTGAVVMLGYSHTKHENWCDHQGVLNLWNVNRKDFSPTVPTQQLKVNACITCVAAHPYEPYIVAAGTYSGELVVWNLQWDNDPVIASSSSVSKGHQEPITHVQWVRDPDVHQQMPLLVSSGLDGKIITWRATSHGDLKLIDCFIILMEHLPHTIHLRSSKTDGELGVSCFSFTPNDPATFIAGVEGGVPFQCSLLSQKSSTRVGEDVPLKDPVIRSFDPHKGHVVDISCSPFHQEIFLTFGSDHAIHIYSMLQSTPVRVLHEAKTVLGAMWSPFHPVYYVTWDDSGGVDIHDIRDESERKFLLSIRCLENLSPITSVCFNPKNLQLVSIGNVKGKAFIWQLPKQITATTPQDIVFLEKLKVGEGKENSV